jgi:serine/threonine protein kinase
MTADQPGFLELPKDDGKGPQASTEESGLSFDRSGSTAGMPRPAAENTVSPPSLIEMVKRDLTHQWEQGRQVSLETYLEAMPVLGTRETVSPDLILAEYRARARFGAMPDLSQYEERFPHQSGILRKLIDQQSQDPQTGSLLGQIDQMMGEPQNAPLSKVRAPKMQTRLPKRFGRYRLVKLLGRGAMGTVYLVHDTQLGRQVALKVPHFRWEEGGTRPEHRDLDRFYREVRVAATLDHPNLCPVYDAGEIDGIPYLVMAYIKGRPLSRYIKRSRPMSQRRAGAIVRKLALALEEAHSQGVVHRDLKPSNIMVNDRRDLIIMDFGLVWRIGAQDERLTRVGLVLGTPAYMSPEQICGKAEGLGPCCDIYSLGVILYELLTGCVPFEGPEAFVLGQIVFAEPAPPSKHRPDVDPLIEAICLRAMAKKVEERYASMRELALALERFLRSRTNTFRPAAETACTDEIAAVMGPSTETPDGATLDELARPPIEAPLAQASSAERTVPPTDLMPLWLALHQWIEIIEHFVLQRSRRSVNHRNYDRLYRMLVQTCQMRAGTTEGATRLFYQRLEDLVVPWMTPRAMECADREILGSLLCYCREAEQALRDRTKPLPDLGKTEEWVISWRVAAVGITMCVVIGLLLVGGWLWF